MAAARRARPWPQKRILKRDPCAFTLLAENKRDETRRPDVVVFPGGKGARAAMEDEALLDWLREDHQHSRWTTSVCTGSLISRRPVCCRVCEPPRTGSRSTGSPSSGPSPPRGRRRTGQDHHRRRGLRGIDMALLLAARLAGAEIAQAVQLSIEYDPEPPFDVGSSERASAEVVERVRRPPRREPSAGDGDEAGRDLCLSSRRRARR